MYTQKIKPQDDTLCNSTPDPAEIAKELLNTNFSTRQEFDKYMQELEGNVSKTRRTAYPKKIETQKASPPPVLISTNTMSSFPKFQSPSKMSATLPSFSNQKYSDPLEAMFSKRMPIIQ
jgi:hypothetical protein